MFKLCYRWKEIASRSTSKSAIIPRLPWLSIAERGFLSFVFLNQPHLYVFVRACACVYLCARVPEKIYPCKLESREVFSPLIFLIYDL